MKKTKENPKKTSPSINKKKLKNVSDLRAYRERLEAARAQNAAPSVWVCGGTGCLANGSRDVLSALETAARGIASAAQIGLRIEHAGCHGQCERGPVVEIEPKGWIYHGVKPSDAREIIEKSVLGDTPIARLSPLKNDVDAPTSDRVPFSALQTKRVLARMGHTDPRSIDDYISQGGYRALEKAFASMSPEAVCEAVTRSGLRGRGGGGFPTGAKWESCRRAATSPNETDPKDKNVKYVLVNGDEGDPGAFMDRSLMEGDPHSVLEGLILGAYAVGATQGFFYIRNEYPQSLANIDRALADARALGLLGEDILGTGFSFDAQVCRGGGAFVCGESTALMASIEGRSGTPRVKYVRSTEKGLWELPTVLNNVETWANVPQIVLEGAETFRSIGTEGSPGTKILALVGKVENTGLVEIPMGTTLRRIIYDIGGGVKKGRAFKAVQTGGPSGGCLPADALDLGVDFDTLERAGSMMGSGGMIVMDDRTCMVDVARYFTSFLVGESCGKCAPCREGLVKMRQVLADIACGRGQPGDIDLLERDSRALADTALCGLGQSAPNPVLSTIRHFRDEYEEHVRERFCRAGVCSGLYAAEISNACVSCGLCKKICPQNAISGERQKTHAVDPHACVGCGACLDVCPVNAISPARRSLPCAPCTP